MNRHKRSIESFRPQIRLFVCPECNTKVPASKYYGKTNAGHIKTMYCYKCQDIRDHVQVE